MDKKARLKDFFRDKGIDLKKLQGASDNVATINKAFHKEDALRVLELYYDMGIPILGGDVLFLDDDGRLTYTYDNWDTDDLKQENDFQFLQKSIAASKDYIHNYHHPLLKDISILFDIVPKCNPNLLDE